MGGRGPMKRSGSVLAPRVESDRSGGSGRGRFVATGFRLDLLASDLGSGRLDFGRGMGHLGIAGLFDSRHHLAQLVGEELHLRELAGCEHGTGEEFAVLDRARGRVEPERRRKWEFHFLGNLLDNSEDTISVEIPLSESVRYGRSDRFVRLAGMIRLF